jgi:hypothetical protein
MTKGSAVQKDLYCPACGQVLTWSCYGKNGNAYCEAYSTHLFSEKNTRHCMYKGTVRRLKNGIVKLNKPTNLERFLEIVVRNLKAHKGVDTNFRWISYARSITLYEQAPHGYFLVATMHVRKDDIEMNNLEVTWDIYLGKSESYIIPRTTDNCASKLDELFSSLDMG